MDEALFDSCSMTEFVGAEVCDTIGLVIANIDPELRRRMELSLIHIFTSNKKQRRIYR